MEDKCYVPEFLNDVFVSYASENDKEEGEDAKGWVASFVEKLSVQIAGSLGPRPRVYLDTKRLTPGMLLADELETQVKGSVIFVPVFSPSYWASGYCPAELEWFQTDPKPLKKRLLGNTTRIMPALMRPDDRNRRLPLGTQFNYVSDDGMTSPFLVKSDAFRQAVGKLGGVIAQRLKEVRNQYRKVFVVSPGLKVKDSGAIVTSVKNELLSKGFAVIPEADSTFYDVAKVEGSELFVHVAGPTYDEKIKQCAQKALDLTLPWILCITKEVKESMDPRQRELVDWLRVQPYKKRLLEGQSVTATVLIETILEQLSPPIEQVISGSGAIERSRAQGTASPSAGSKKVFLVCNREDTEESNRVFDLKSHIEEKKVAERKVFEVTWPDANLSKPNVLRDYKQKLLVCDGVLLYWGNTNRHWFQANRVSIYKALAERARMYAADGVYITDPRNPEKDEEIANIKTEEPENGTVVIEQFEKFDPAELNRFLARILNESTGGGTNEPGESASA